MNTKNLNDTLSFLTSIKNNKCLINEEEKVNYLYTELTNIKNKLPTEEKLNKLNKIVIDLEVKYDILNELSYYFDPLYSELKRKIHEEYIKEIRKKAKKRK